MRIGDGEYLIPGQTVLHVIGRDGGRTENTTVYSGYHEFRGESAVRFDEVAPAADSGPEVPMATRVPQLPPGLPVALVLDTEIDTGRAAADDLITARLSKPVIDPATKRVLAPSDAVVRGRITHLEHHIAGENYFLPGLMFESLQREGISTPVNLILDSLSRVQDSSSANFDRALGPRLPTTESRSRVHSSGTFLFRTGQSRYVVARGYSSKWVTGTQP
jgi:hypothetical protein